MTYIATVKHHSIAQHRSITLHNVTLTQVKQAATREFGAGFADHEIVIYDDNHNLVASRRIGDHKWR